MNRVLVLQTPCWLQRLINSCRAQVPQLSPPILSATGGVPSLLPTEAEAVPLSPQHPVAKSLPGPRPVPLSLTGCCRDRVTSQTPRGPLCPPKPRLSKGRSNFHLCPTPLPRLEIFLHKRLSVYTYVRIGSGQNCSRGEVWLWGFALVCFLLL